MKEKVNPNIEHQEFKTELHKEKGGILNTILDANRLSIVALRTVCKGDLIKAKVIVARYEQKILQEEEHLKSITPAKRTQGETADLILITDIIREIAKFKKRVMENSL